MSCVYTVNYLGFGINEHKLEWTAESNGSVVSFKTPEVNAAVFMGLTIPDTTTPPTDEYSITLLDSLGVDVFGGELAERSSTLNEQVLPKIGSGYGTRYASSKLTFAVSGNLVANAKGIFVFYSVKIDS